MMIVILMTMVMSSIVFAGENLFTNSAFELEKGENIPFDWDTWTKRLVLFETIEEPGDNTFKISSLLFDGRGSLRRIGVPVEGGNVYLLEVMYKADLGGPHPNDWVPTPVVVRIQWFKDGPTEAVLQIDEDRVAALNPSEVWYEVREGHLHLFGDYQQSDWTKLWVNAPAPEGARFALVDFLIWSAQGEVLWKSPVFKDVTDEIK
jgi:hypothetical protein